METLTLPAWLEARQLLGEPSWQHETHNLLPSRNLKIGDGVNNSSSESRACVFGPGFTEEIDSLTKVEIRSIAYDGSRHAHRPSAL